MKNLFFICILLVLIASQEVVAQKSKQIKLIPVDCGPLARKEFGVVFSATKQGVTKVYFAKGKAHILCPCIMESKFIEGFEYDLCRDYTPPRIDECEKIKEFVILNCNTAN